ncbi:MAG: hypothetical protein JXR86_05710 [Spirochaetales bacterium]|nr:hypothetical protein [Spirochaetales bacterium]
MKGKIFILLTTLFILDFYSVSLWGEAGILFLSGTGEEPSGSRLAEIIDHSISLELERAGFAVYGRSQKDIRTYRYRVEGEYLVRDRDLDVNLLCTRSADGMTIYSSRNTVPVNFALDTSVARIARDMVGEINRDLLMNPLPETEVVKGDPAEDAELVSEPAGEPESPAGDSEPLPERKPAVDTEPQPEENAEKTGGLMAPPRQLKPLSLSLGFSPLLPAGEIADYFKLAYSPDILVSYRFPLSFGYLGTGIFFSFTYFEAEGLLVSADNILLSFGPDLLLGLYINRYLDLIFRINGGATVYMLNRNESGYVSKWIPDFSGGLGIAVYPHPSFCLSLAANYSVYLESSTVISGFTPSLRVQLNL